MREFQSRHNLPFYQVSACTGAGIDDMFFAGIDQIGVLISKLNRLAEPPEKPQVNHPADPPLSSKPITIEPEPYSLEVPKKRCCS